MMKEKPVIKWFHADEIHEDKDNPNAMNELEFTALMSEIIQSGFIQPIITRICKCEIISKEHRIIVGGEHRWRAAQHPEIAMKEVPCIDVDLNDEDAKLLMINLNRIHGNFIPLKLANLIVDVNKKFPIDKLQKRLHVSKEQLLGMMYPKASESIPFASTPIKQKNKPVKETTLFTIALTKDQISVVKRILDDVMNRLSLSKAEALVAVCESYNSKINERGAGSEDK